MCSCPLKLNKVWQNPTNHELCLLTVWKAGVSFANSVFLVIDIIRVFCYSFFFAYFYTPTKKVYGYIGVYWINFFCLSAVCLSVQVAFYAMMYLKNTQNCCLLLEDMPGKGLAYLPCHTVCLSVQHQAPIVSLSYSSLVILGSTFLSKADYAQPSSGILRSIFLLFWKE